MKKLFNALGTIAMLAVILIFFASCDDLMGLLNIGDQNKVTDTYKPQVYTSSVADGTKYVLTITRPSKAVKDFTPGAGDSYKLDITSPAGVTQTSSGTVNSFSGNRFTLTASINVSVSFEVTVSTGDNSISNISGTITVGGGVTIDGPGTITPVVTFVAVTGITGVPTSAAVGSLTLAGTVVPANATNKTIAWIVKSAGSTGATISGSTLTTTSTGTVTVTATIANGKTASTAYTQDFDINITGGSVSQTFTTVDAFKTWLDAQPENTKNTVYNVKLNVNSLGGNSDTIGSAGKALVANSTKYVSLDLSGSTFTSIEHHAFWNCTSLTGVNMGNGVTSIGYNAFDSSGLTSVTIPDNVTSIGQSVFLRCTSLTSVTIGNGVTEILFSQGPFTGCTSLTTLNVASGNTEFAAENGVLYNKNKTTLFYYPEGKRGSFTIPNSVTRIGENAFSDCIGLTSVTIPDSVTSIEFGAFYGTGLTSVIIPNKVTSIWDWTFGNCTSLTSVNIGSGVTSIGSEAFYGAGLTSVTIPNKVTSIGNSAFNNCTSLASVNIGSGVTSIGHGAFWDTGLTSVTFQSMIASEDFENAFDGDLRERYLDTSGGIGTYTRTANATTWTKQQQ
jgi:hypothetical protein